MAQPASSIIPVVPLPLQDANVHLPTAQPNSYNALRIGKKRRGVKRRPDGAQAAVTYQYRIAPHANIQDGELAVAPPWFVPAMRRALRPIEDRMDRILRSARLLNADAKRLINSNRRTGNGSVVHFDIVPFHDGSDPTKAPHGLPPIHSFDSIDALTGRQLVAYLRGYGYGGRNQQPLPVGPNNHETNRQRKHLLKRLVSI